MAVVNINFLFGLIGVRSFLSLTPPASYQFANPFRFVKHTRRRWLEIDRRSVMHVNNKALESTENLSAEQLLWARCDASLVVGCCRIGPWPARVVVGQLSTWFSAASHCDIAVAVLASSSWSPRRPASFPLADGSVWLKVCTKCLWTMKNQRPQRWLPSLHLSTAACQVPRLRSAAARAGLRPATASSAPVRPDPAATIQPREFTRTYRGSSTSCGTSRAVLASEPSCVCSARRERPLRLLWAGEPCEWPGENRATFF